MIIHDSATIYEAFKNVLILGRGRGDSRRCKRIPGFDSGSGEEVRGRSSSAAIKDAPLAREDVVLCRLDRPSHNAVWSGHESSLVSAVTEVSNEDEGLVHMKTQSLVLRNMNSILPIPGWYTQQDDRLSSTTLSKQQIVCRGLTLTFNDQDVSPISFLVYDASKISFVVVPRSSWLLRKALNPSKSSILRHVHMWCTRQRAR